MSELQQFIVIGENIHTSRVVLKRGKRFVSENGHTGVVFTSLGGESRLLQMPDAAKSGQDYLEGRIKHVKFAVQAGMEGGAEAETGVEYLRTIAVSQERAGAHFLDINVDEISVNREEQRAAMAWLVEKVQTMTTLPVSVDSSDITVIKAGLEAASGRVARPLLNSASLERIDALDVALAYGSRVIVTAAGDSGMPAGAEERVENASRMVDTALEKGIAPRDIFVDPLIFPISVDGAYGRHSLDAIQNLRERYGPEIHITGGMSNVSFGIPARGVMNAVFINLAVEAGADSGIVDPIMNRVDEVLTIDRGSDSYKLAEDVLLGRDEHCLNFIGAWRNGELEPLVSGA